MATALVLLTGGGLLLSEPAYAEEGGLALGASVEGPARSGQAIVLKLTGQNGTLTPGEVAAVTWKDPGTGNTQTSYTTVNPEGVASFTIRSWKDTEAQFAYADLSVPFEVKVAPQLTPTRFPEAAPQRAKKYRDNTDPAAIGSGANPKISKLDKDRRASMRGLSWRPGCVPLDQLREVSFNYWGTDGYRHRGVLIARADVAKRTASAFSDLYDVKYRFHSIHPVDRYGPSPRGVGANDYASMAAGNTSMFNCRYVVGQESSRAWSPHASGRAVDINPWENPYVARGGIYPNSWYLQNRTSPLAIRPGTAVYRIVTSHGWSWGGSYRDYHHFD